MPEGTPYEYPRLRNKAAAGSAAWGTISGTLSDQTDLQTALDGKVPTTRTLTINGTSHDLSADRSWTVTGSVAWGGITGTLSAQTDLQSALDGKVDENVAITGASKTKITYDAKGLVTAGADATTADIADSTNKRYVNDADLVDIGNLSGVNTGDQTSIVGITGTLAQFNTALTGADFATGGGVITGTSSGTNTGDQTSIAGISGTKAQFNTACSDGDFLYVGDDTSSNLNPNLQVLTADYTVPANKSLVFNEPLTLSNNVALTIPSTGSIIVMDSLANGTPEPREWDSIIQTSAPFVGYRITSFIDIAGLIFAAVANARYVFQVLLVGQSSTTGGIQVQLGFTGVATAASFSGTAESTQGTGLLIGGSNAGGTPTIWTSANADEVAFFTGHLLVGVTGGNLTIQVAKITAGFVTINAGSLMKIRRIS